MTATNPQIHSGTVAGAPRASSTGMAKGLGWFSIGLGVAEFLTPGAIARFIGITDDGKTRALLRGYGLREIGAGAGLLSQPQSAAWVWGRVAGDMLDLSSLLSAFKSEENHKGRLTAATIAVAGVTALDVLFAKDLSQQNGNQRGNASRQTRSIIVQRSPEEAYRLWRDIENLPRFMTYLETVRATDERRSHWAARVAGTTIEWDAEIVNDQPNRLIAWKSLDGSVFGTAGNVLFEKAPGNRGTLVRAEIDFAPNGRMLSRVAGKIIGPDIGRRIAHDLRNFKQVLELGEVTQSDASIFPGMHPAQPPRDWNPRGITSEEKETAR